MTPLEYLVARTEICELKARYCRLVDTHQWEAFATLFLPDVEVDISDDVPAEHGGGAFTGRDKLVGNTRHFMEQGESAHHVHGSEISFDDADHASAIWSMYDRVIFPDGGPVPFYGKTSHGFYHERYVRTADGWKIAALRLQRVATTIESKPPA
jgi:SnoaL-like domain